MSRSSTDNAATGIFFGLLKRELPYLQKLQSPKDFKRAPIDYFEYCGNRRIKAKPKGLAARIARTASPFGCLNNIDFDFV